ncbi:MAG: hypothetical protein AAFX06_04910 [Planctomycetota bacterium]
MNHSSRDGYLLRSGFLLVRIRTAAEGVTEIKSGRYPTINFPTK